MSSEVLLLAATAVLAVVALAAAVVAVRAVRRLGQSSPTSGAVVEQREPAPGTDLARIDQRTADPVRPQPVVRLIEGRVIASPTEQQVVATALGRPGARVSVYAAGLAHALRPESRDRIQAIVRREFRRRRRLRQRLARRAARQVPARALHPDETWLSGGSATELPRAVGE